MAFGNGAADDTPGDVEAALDTGRRKRGQEAALRNNLIKRTLGLADKGLPIGREVEPAGFIRWKLGENDETRDDRTAGADGAIAWRDYVWTAPAVIGDCAWELVRWRFYASGMICFEAKMKNDSGRFDNGDVQGHRLELREKNGLLIGVWIAGFFVRKGLAMRGFHATLIEDHLPLKLHYGELTERQGGAWDVFDVPFAGARLPSYRRRSCEATVG